MFAVVTGGRMKSFFQNRYLLHSAKAAQGQRGFTLIELLVVLIIVGVLATIAIPSFVRQVNRARAAEGTSNVAAINRAQQLYYSRQLRFAQNVNDLDARVEDKYYSYTVDSPISTYASVKTVTQWSEMKPVSGAIVTEKGAMKWVVCISDAEVPLGDVSVIPANVPMALLACPATYKELGS